VALGLVSLILIVRSLEAFERIPGVYGPVVGALAAASVASLFVGWLRPAPWLLALALVAILSVVWLFAIGRWVRVRDPQERVAEGSARPQLRHVLSAPGRRLSTDN
jgi:membrane protein implicated in regulation of membrane protease activity